MPAACTPGTAPAICCNAATCRSARGEAVAVLGRNGMGKKATEGLAALIVAEIRRLMGDVRISGIFTPIVGRDQRKALARSDQGGCHKNAGWY